MEDSVSDVQKCETCGAIRRVVYPHSQPGGWCMRRKALVPNFLQYKGCTQWYHFSNWRSAQEGD